MSEKYGKKIADFFFCEIAYSIYISGDFRDFLPESATDEYEMLKGYPGGHDCYFDVPMY